MITSSTTLFKSHIVILSTCPQDWTKVVTGLWQTEPRDFYREKAFNELISRMGQRCCICSMFDIPSPYLALDRSELDTRVSALRALANAQPKITPLTVVVKRALVSLPDSLLTKCMLSRRNHDEIKGSCDARGGLHDSDSDDEDGSQIVVCRKCSIAVHKCKSNNVWLFCVLYVNPNSLSCVRECVCYNTVYCVINPRRACAARVTVLCLSVRLSVCLIQHSRP